MSFAGYCAKAEGGASGRGDRGVRVGLDGADGGAGQHVPVGRGGALRPAQHRGPDHLHQRHLARRAPAVRLPKLRQGQCACVCVCRVRVCV